MVGKAQSDPEITGVSLELLPGLHPGFFAQRIIEKILPIDQLNELCREILAEPCKPDFFSRLLQALSVRYAVRPDDLSNVPKSGPAIVVANHPFGAIEGIVIAAILRSVRPDVKILANHFLRLIQVREITDSFIFVNPFEGFDAFRTNIRPMREALHWLDSGGMLVIFPAGEVAHLHLSARTVTDPEWNPSIARLARRTAAPVLPVYFGGSNGILFQLAGLVHKRLRTILLPREFLNKRNRTLEVKIGGLIPPKRFDRFAKDLELTDYLRSRTYLLQYRTSASVPPAPKHVSTAQPVADACDPKLLAREVSSLTEDHNLIERNGFAVLCAQAHEIPHVLREIGRQREIAFRRAGEGTGRPLDLDRFDEYYHHIFLWNRSNAQLAGAYRIGSTEHILHRHGIGGLYTSTLFKYGRRFFSCLGPALEMGRSFISAAYQRDSTSLPLLWKGIAQYAVRHPQHRYLFGAVSISDSYQVFSKRLIISYLKPPRLRRRRNWIVQPRNPFPAEPLGQLPAYELVERIQSVQELSECIEEIEPDGKGIPVLFKHYLKLGGKTLAFNVDPDFSNVVDALLLVDLLNTDARALEHLMGAEGAAAFLRYHKSSERRAACNARQPGRLSGYASDPIPQPPA
jgi:putative hemolysin